MDYYWSTLVGVALAMVLGYYWISVFTAIIRRLHDRNLYGWWILVSIIPFLGNIALIILMCLPQHDFGNNWSKEI